MAQTVPKVSLRRANIALTHAIRYCPQDSPLYASLLALLCPLAAAADREDGPCEEIWKSAIKRLIDFADDVKVSLPSGRDRTNNNEVAMRLEGLNADAISLYNELDSRGLFTAFTPTFMQQQLWSRIVSCFAQAPGDGLVRDPMLKRNDVRYEVMFRSIDTYYGCISRLLGTEVKLHHIAQALLSFLKFAQKVPIRPKQPSAGEKCPEPNIGRFADICARARELETRLRRSSIPQNDAEQIENLMLQLRLTGFNFKGNLDFDLTNSSIRFPTILGGTSRSVVYPAILHAKDDARNASWDMNIAIKVYIPNRHMVTREMHFRHQALFLQTLSHPCLLSVHDAFWPIQEDGRITSDVLVISELMSHNLREAREHSAFRSMASRVRLLQEIVQGLNHLHQSGVTHQALTPNNVLVRIYEGRWCGRAKIDTSNILNSAIFEQLWDQDCANLSLYYAPEMLAGLGKYYTGDVWSLGVLICFLFGGSAPSLPRPEHGGSYTGQVDLWGAIQTWCKSIKHDNVQSIANMCLRKRPEERPTAARLLEALDLLMHDARLEQAVDNGLIETEGNSVTLNTRTPNTSHGARPTSIGNDKGSQFRNGAKGVDGREQVLVATKKDGELSQAKRRVSTELPNPAKRRKEVQAEGVTDDPDWGALEDEHPEGVQGLGEMYESDDSNESEEVVRRRPRRSSRMRGKSLAEEDNVSISDDEEPGLTLKDVLSARAVDTSPSPNKPKGSTPKKEVSEELYIPSDAAATSVSPTNGFNSGDGLGASRRQVNSPGDTGSLNRKFAAALDRQSIDKNELYVGPEQRGRDMRDRKSPSPSLSAELVQQIRSRYGAQLQTFNDLNRFAESLQESGKPGCMEEAAQFFKIAADAGVPKAQVNYGICREQGRGVNHDFCEAALYYQNAASQGDPRGQMKIGLCHELGKGTKKDFRVAAEWYTRAASQGYPQAQANLGIAYQCGRGVRKDLAKAFDLYHEAAKANNNIAQLNLGVMYENGQGVEKNLTKAFELYQKSATNGNNRAMMNLALCFERGNGVEKSLTNAAVRFVQAADAGNGRAMFKAGQCFHKGEGLKQNLTKAAFYYERASKLENHGGAMYSLAIFYENGTGVVKNLEKAFELFREAAERKHPAASYKLAECYKRGIGVKQNRNMVIQYYRQAASLGNPNAKLELGYLYENGEGVKKSSETAVRLYREAAAAGLPAAEWALGQCHYFGYGMSKNIRAAVKLFESAIEKGNDGACLELGNLYKDGNDVEQNMEKACELYEIGAKRGNSECQVNCGECYFYGKGVPKDYAKAVSYFRLAAKNEDPEGYRWLGDCFADGCGVEKDQRKAAEYFRLGAEMRKDRSAPAECCLGECYEKGLGVEKDGGKALMYYKRSASRNNGTAMNNLGIMYENGYHVKKDYATAFRYYDKAVNLGLTDAFCNLADCYAAGNGVKKNLVKAADLYRQGAEHGLPEAQCELGVCYYYGKGVERDRVKGIHFLEKASASEPEAMRHLGIAYWDGLEVKQDFTKAYELVSKAAEAGNVDAYFNLGIFHELGTGVKQDYSKAAEYYLKAAEEGGNKFAMRFLGNLYFEGRLGEPDEKLAEEWLKRADLSADDIFHSINV